MVSHAARAASLGEFEQLILLALVRLCDNAYGATIHQEVQNRTRRPISISAVYTTLDRLAEKGFVESHTGDPTPRRGGRRKKFFRLMPDGAEALSQSYRVFREMTRGLERRLEQL
jgi:DNA-binding PadR family transcriptional regulator